MRFYLVGISAAVAIGCSSGGGPSNGGGSGGGSLAGATGSILDGQTVFQGSLPDVSSVSYTTFDGDSLVSEFAYPGLVIVMVRGTTGRASVESAVTALGGSIIDAIPRAGLYTAKVVPGGEETFIDGILVQSFVVDAAPLSPFTEAKMTAIDYHTGMPGKCKPHGQNVAAVMARGGQPVGTVDLSGHAFAKQIQPIAGLGVVGDWTPALARNVITEMESSAKAGQHVAINLSLQSIASSVGDARGEGRKVCNDPKTAGALECKVIQQEQLVFLETLFQTMENETPAVRGNTVLIIAAGNAGIPLTGQIAKLMEQYPAAAKSIAIVGATDAAGNIDTTLNHGAGMVYARGRGVAALPGQICDGTSFAAPEVTRILDEMWRANPALTSDQVLALFSAALSTCPRMAGAGTTVPQAADGTTPAAFMTCATNLAKMGAPTKTSFTLTTKTAGTGQGIVNADRFGPTYPAGTVVTLMATASSTSIFTGWSGACVGTGACEITMNSDITVTATFDLPDRYVGNYAGPFGTATSNVGCGYSVAVSGRITLTLHSDGAGNVTGTGSVDTTVTTSVTNTPAGTSCTGGAFTTTSVGPVSGTTTQFQGTFTDGSIPRPYQMMFSGALNGTTVTGSATTSKIMHSTSTAGDEDFPMSATFQSITLTKQ